ncbi:MAG: HI0074 family nucleotidyltransferase substrate-binding subunit [Candidatus Gracilibacteria bacterium]
MDLERVKQRYTHFQEALARLEEAVAMKPKDRLALDGLIQRFEFSFELGWKVLKDWLNYKGFEVSAPRDVIQKGFQESLLEDFDGWLKMLELRNVSSHEYSLEKADGLIKLIQEKFSLLLRNLKDTLDKQL